MVQKQIAVDEERNALPGKILYEQEHAHECFLSDSSFLRDPVFNVYSVKKQKKGSMTREGEKADDETVFIGD